MIKYLLFSKVNINSNQKQKLQLHNQDHTNEGTDEYKANMEYLKTTIAELKTKEGRNKIKVKTAKQKITDGIRQCTYGGNVNTDRFPEGDGILLYGK